MKIKDLLGVILMVVTIPACNQRDFVMPTPTNMVKVSTQTVREEARSIRLYNLVADTSYLALDIGSDHIRFGSVAKWTVTEYHNIQDLADPVYVILSTSFDELEPFGPFDIINDIVAGENTFVLQRENGQVVILPFDNDIDLRTEPKLDEIWMLVGPHKAPCEKKSVDGMCFLVKDMSEITQENFVLKNDWEIFMHEIGGFSYEPGYEYELLVFKFENNTTGSVWYKLHHLLDKKASSE